MSQAFTTMLIHPAANAPTVLMMRSIIASHLPFWPGSKTKCSVLVAILICSASSPLCLKSSTPAA
jgi:hypothetical protein